MGTDFSNYDVFESLLDNNRRARKWTTIWITVLCILSGIVITLAITNARQKKTIADLNLNADYKSKVIDSLKGLIQKEVDRKVDSLSNYITTIGENIQKIENDPVASISEKAQQKEKLQDVSNSIRNLNNSVQQIKTDFSKNRLRFFIQYNDANNSKQVTEVANYLRKNGEYFIAPPELLERPFSNLIKVYNYEDKDQVMKFREIIAGILRLPADQVPVKYLDDSKQGQKSMIEVWIGNPNIKAPAAAY